MPATSEWQPRTVERVDTKYRKIVTPIPVPDSIPILEKLKRFEPEAMGGQPRSLGPGWKGSVSLTVGVISGSTGVPVFSLRMPGTDARRSWTRL
jgi:hypothetical protein